MLKAETPFKTEFAVEMSCSDCVESVTKALSGVSGIDRFDVDLAEQRVVVEGTAAPSKVSRLLKTTGRSVIVRGQGTVRGAHTGAAVCIFEPFTYMPTRPQDPIPERKPSGLARFVQIDNDICLIDVTVEGLSPGSYGVHIHEHGDISDGPTSTGGHYDPTGVAHGDAESGHVGDLGNVEVDKNGWGDLLVESHRIKVWDIIGRSMVISHGEDDLGRGSSEQSKIDGNSGPGMIAGIIARSAGVFENAKKVCTCSGRTLWEESRIQATDD